MKKALRSRTSEAVFLLAAAASLAAVSLPAQDGTQKTFGTAQHAVKALIEANRSNDIATLNQILGPEASTLISSGDDAQDKNDRAHFVALYDAHHRLAPAGAEQMTLVVGKNEWPLPIPLEKSNGAWRFDSTEGTKESLSPDWLE